MLEMGIVQIALPKINGSQVGVGKIGEGKIAVAEVRAAEIGTHQTGTLKMDALKKCAGDIHADKRNTIGVEFLKCFHAAAAAAFPLRRVDNLPGLIVFLLKPVAGFRKIENNGDKDAEAAQIFKDFEKRPVAENVGDPFPEPLEGPQWHGPGVPDRLSPERPWDRPFSVKTYLHTHPNRALDLILFHQIARQAARFKNFGSASSDLDSEKVGKRARRVLPPLSRAQKEILRGGAGRDAEDCGG